MNGQEYVEGVVTIKPGADSARVRDWFSARGFEAMDMAAGLLISAPGTTFRNAFGLDEDQAESLAEKRLEIPVPAALQDQVQSIVVPPPPSPHATQRRI